MTHKKGRIWTIEQRQKQAERIRNQKPWTKSTGPRTTRGKLASSRNAYRHGCYGTEFKMMLQYLRLQKHYSDTLRLMLKYDLFEDETHFEISGNELNENPTKSIQNATERPVKTGVKTTILIPHSHSRKSSLHAIPFYRHPRAGGDPVRSIFGKMAPNLARIRLRQPESNFSPQRTRSSQRKNTQRKIFPFSAPTPLSSFRRKPESFLGREIPAFAGMTIEGELSASSCP